MLIAFLMLAGLALDPSPSAELVRQPRTYAPFAQIRPVDRNCGRLIRRGTEASQTFRHLVMSIEASDLIVYIQCGQPLRIGVVGVTRLATRAGGYRYVRVSIDHGVSGDEAVAILGHELYHVTELAAAPAVVDSAGVRELYMTLGHRTCTDDPPCFDTTAARQAGDGVLRELRKSANEVRRRRRVWNCTNDQTQAPAESFTQRR